jgi:hypothetical protein
MVILKKVKTKERWNLGFQRKERRWQENNPDTLEGEEKVRQRSVKTEREGVDRERDRERKRDREKERETERKRERKKERE